MPNQSTAISVPLRTLQKLLRLADEGTSPRIHWSESREKMDAACQRRRGEIFTELQQEIEPLIPEHARRP